MNRARERSERRGPWLLGAMVAAAGLVIAMVFLMAFIPTTAVMVCAVLVLIATIIGGLAWILPILYDGDD